MQTPIDVQEPEIDDHTETDAEARKAQQLEAYLRDSVVGRYIQNYNKRLRTLNQAVEKRASRSMINSLPQSNASHKK